MKSNYKYFTSVALSSLFGVLVAFSASAQHRGGGGGGGSRGGFSGGGGGSHMSSGGGGGRSGGFSGGSRPSYSGGGGVSRGSAQSPGAGSYSRSNGGGYSGRQQSSGYTPRTNSAPQSYSRGGSQGVRTQAYANRGGNSSGGLRTQAYGGGTRNQSYSRGGNVYSNSPQRVYANRGGLAYGGRGGNVYRGRVTSAFGSRYGNSVARVAYRDGYFHGSFYNGRYVSYNRFYGHSAFYNRLYYPRLGFQLSVLPYGYYPFYWGDYQYYYSGGYYYTYDDNNYTVVEPPMGAIMDQLPSGAKSLMVDGAQYYELNGVYYQAITKDDGNTGYQIAGKDGELTTAASVTEPGTYDQDNGGAMDQGNTDQAPIKIGDLFDSLPPNTTAIKIDGQKYFVSPDGVYYQEDRDGSRKVYRVAGTPDDQPK